MTRFTIVRISNRLKLSGTLGFVCNIFTILRMVLIEVYKEGDEKDSLSDSQIFTIGSKVYNRNVKECVKVCEIIRYSLRYSEYCQIINNPIYIIIFIVGNLLECKKIRQMKMIWMSGTHIILFICMGDNKL